VKPTKALTRAVNQIVRKNEETKLIIDAPWKSDSTLASFTDFTTAITGTGEIYCLTPRLIQGVDDNNRIGNEVRPVSLTSHFTVSINTRMTASAYIDVHFYFLTCKGVKRQPSVSQVPIGRLLNNGAGNNVGFSGDSYVAKYPVNKSDFTLIKHKVCRLFKTQDCPNLQAVGSGALSTVGSGKLNYFQQFKVKIPTPKVLKYESLTEVAPSNHFPFVVIGWTFPDDNGGSISGDINDIRVQGQSQMYYKDA